MAMIGKVTSFVTRQGRSGPEVCVFAHPLGGVQLPAGTLLPGEEPVDGARREAFEETGLADLRLVGKIATIPATDPATAIINRPAVVGDRTVVPGCYARVLERDTDVARVEVAGTVGTVETRVLSFDAWRHLYHFATTQPAPHEWWVLTPDGDGLCWRCHWLPVDAATDTLDLGQRPWLDLARGQLREVAPGAGGAVRALDPAAAVTIEMFWAPPWSASRALVSWLDPDAHPAEAVERVEAVAFTGRGEIVAVAAAEEGGRWVLPGGPCKPGEALEGALRRELRASAAAEVRRSELLGFRRLATLDSRGARAGPTGVTAVCWSHVELHPVPTSLGHHARRLLSTEAALGLPLWSDPITQRLLGSAVHVQRHRHAPGT